MNTNSNIMAIKGAFWELKQAGKLITPASIVQQSKTGEDGELFDTDYPAIISYMEMVIGLPGSWRNYNHTRCNGYLQIQPLKKVTVSDLISRAD